MMLLYTDIIQMTCVFDSMYKKVIRGRYTNIKNIRQMAAHLKTHEHKLLPSSMRVNGVALSIKQRKEAREALRQLKIGDGYLMSAFDPLYLYCAWVFRCRITHNWRLSARHVGNKNWQSNITNVYEDLGQPSGGIKQVTFVSTATHTE